jgi:hypothetical protein
MLAKEGAKKQIAKTVHRDTSSDPTKRWRDSIPGKTPCKDRNGGACVAERSQGRGRNAQNA